MARLLSELDPEKFDITVVAIADTPPDVVSFLPCHVKLKHLKLDSRNTLRGLGEIVKTLRSTDILVCSLFHATAVGVPLGTVLRVPQILVWQHNTVYSSRLRSLYYRLAYRIADQVLADSDSVRKMLVGSIGIPEKKITTLPIAGVDTGRLQPGENTKDSQIKIGTVGRLVEQKGHVELLRTARELSGYEFHVVGDGPMYDELTESAPDNVYIHGRVDDEELLTRLQKSDIYFQPSRHEGLCMTVIEAMACGLPVVASAVGGITESVVPDQTGFLCESGEITCYTRHLKQLAENDELRAKMGRSGRERVISEYSKEALRRQFRKAIEQSKTVS
jgi:glycosyltransferase involved in cell wall biosynthesis